MFFSFSNASHVLGGNITWTCQGGDYVFELTFYRDCNGATFNPVSENIDVWGHPSVSQITVNYISNTDISPSCSPVLGAPTPLDCGTGANGGNGIGAIEKIIYRSAPITLNGTPPSSGWIFTYQNFSRNGSITNLTNPSTKGITIVSKMFAVPNSVGNCSDNSPRFLEDPYFVSCVGDPFSLNMNAIDEDRDSLRFIFSNPLDHFPGTSYNPPITPPLLAFEPNFSANSPTPNNTINPANQNTQLDPNTGILRFLSNNLGAFVVKITVQSYRNGVLIAEIDREMELIVLNCLGSNNPPNVTTTLPLPTSDAYEINVDAGALVNFDINSTDVEVLQDGSPQNNILTTSGWMYGSNFTSTTGCDTPPCATITSIPPISTSQGVSTTFNWQTTCNHLQTPNGITLSSVPYTFVFKIQDDFCPVPKIKYTTVTVNVKNIGVLPAPEVECIQTAPNGDVIVSWSPITDNFGTFVEYQLHSENGGMLQSFSNINTGSATLPSTNQSENFWIATASGCNGQTLTQSDTVSNIHLELNNPSDGRAILQWNNPHTPPLSGMNDFYHIYQEYPTGTWTLIDSVPFGTNQYIDTITICQSFLNYQIILPNQPCDYTSNIVGDNFEDMITPDIPIITAVSIDTTTGNVNISWNENNQTDTYGYVIYQADANGIVLEIDTVYGISNTEYIHITNTSNTPLTYSVAAFDSCETSLTPPTFQTSAKAELHTSNFLNNTLNICNRTVDLSWTGYEGWTNSIQYEVFYQINGGNWTSNGTTTSLNETILVEEGKNYCFVIKATRSDGVFAFSNRSCRFVSSPQLPDFHYLSVATVNNATVELRHYVDASSSVSEIAFQRLNDNNIFEEIGRVPANANNLTFTDPNVMVNEQSYTYRSQLIDSCGLPSISSNEVETILLQSTVDEVAKLSYLHWSDYRGFDGGISHYHIYRSVNGVFNPTPIATLNTSQRSFEDDLNSIFSNGQVCYRVEAVESMNVYGFNERSASNVSCVDLPPLVYIPNAFTPQGNNPIFIPIISDFDPSDYSFTILNRWGQTVFRTTDHNEGWEGKSLVDGKTVPFGTYTYIIEFRAGNGEAHREIGHVTLIK